MKLWKIKYRLQCWYLKRRTPTLFPSGGTVYYVSAIHGSDSNDGLWRTDKAPVPADYPNFEDYMAKFDAYIASIAFKTISHGLAQCKSIDTVMIVPTEESHAATQAEG